MRSKNLVILAAFAAGMLLVLLWLMRAAREESAINRFARRNAERVLGRSKSLFRRRSIPL